jgi:Uma2 family endonuclease
MVVAAPEPKTNFQQPLGEQRVVLWDLTWEGYLQILDALPESRGSRLTYDHGVLEITVPLEEHEFCADNIAYFLLTLVELMGRNVDFDRDPPPDLVVEVDITHTDIQKNQFYALLAACRR